MIIGEFVGAPGVGKSVICEKVVKHLTEAGYKVYKEPSEWKHLERVRLMLQRWSLYTGKNQRKLLKEGRKLIPNLESANRDKWFRITVLISKYIDMAERQKADYIIMDEGCIQAITSIDHGAEISDEVLKWARQVLSTIYADRNVRIFNCELSMEENLRRLKGRGRGGDRFIAEDDESTIKNISVKRNNLDKVLSLTDCRKCTLNLDNGSDAYQTIIDELTAD